MSQVYTQFLSCFQRRVLEYVGDLLHEACHHNFPKLFISSSEVLIDFLCLVHVLSVASFIEPSHGAAVVVPAIKHISHLIERLDIFDSEFGRDLIEKGFLKVAFYLNIGT